MIRLLLPLFALFTFIAPASAQKNNLLEEVVSATPELQPYVDSLEQYEIKVLLSEIERDKDGKPSLTTHYWGADSTQYFYPASTIKMPVAALALQRLHDLNVLGLNAETPMYHGRGTAEGSAPQTAVRFDTSAVNDLPSVGQYARKIFAVSDNDAYVRLFEWLGPTAIMHGLSDQGIERARLIHRVGVGGFNTETHQYLNPVRFEDNLRTLYEIGERYDPWFTPLPEVKGQYRGEAYTTGDSLVNTPFDFSHKNYLSVRHLHDILVRIVLPEAVPADERLRLREEDREMMLAAMHTLPRDSKSPRYDKADNYVKFWMYGDRDEDFEIPDHIKMYNKVGWAYGYLTDVAYIVDERSGKEFVLVGTIHVNRNRTFNDGVYEYESEGLPFFGILGRAVFKRIIGK